MNGALTVGENIADIGGTKLAFAASRAARAGQMPLGILVRAGQADESTESLRGLVALRYHRRDAP